MGLVLHEKDVPRLQKISERERAPFYVVGETTGDMNFKFENSVTGEKPIDWSLRHLFGSSPKTILEDQRVENNFEEVVYDQAQLTTYIKEVLQLEAVACKDWLTNKVDRSVTGRVAKQQTTGAIQLPLNDVAVMAIDYTGTKGIATSIGHAPVAALANPEAGSRLAIAEALTNLVWAPLEHGLSGVSLSANWMWPAKNKGENDRLYRAVEAVSDFAIELGINIPTGKDSLSMTQKYPDGNTVYSPGTVIISSIATCSNIRKVVTPDLKPVAGSVLFYIDFSKDTAKLGGSSFAQVINKIGNEPPTIKDSIYFITAFAAIQQLIKENEILAGHDISSGGIITALLEMTFPTESIGLKVNMDQFQESDPIKALFAENPGVIIQVKNKKKVRELLTKEGLAYVEIAEVTQDKKVVLDGLELSLDVEQYRDIWFRSSYLLDQKQSGKQLALDRFNNYKKQPRSEEHTSELQSRPHLVCRLLLEKKKT